MAEREKRYAVRRGPRYLGLHRSVGEPVPCFVRKEMRETFASKAEAAAFRQRWRDTWQLNAPGQDAGRVVSFAVKKAAPRG